MKTFHFPLERALRWRQAQLDIEKARFAEIVQRQEETKSAFVSWRRETDREAVALRTRDQSPAFACYEAYQSQSRRRLQELAERAAAAQKDAAAERARLLEASSRARLLEKLKSRAVTQWERDLDRETETFASEAFLFHR